MQAPDETADLDLLIEAAREAGEIAGRYWKNTPRTWDKAMGAGPVTEADLAIDEMLHDRLRSARPGYGWLSEETEDDTSRLERETVFIVDPIDGTRAFINGSPTFSHALAVVSGGRVVAGVVYLPMLDRLFAATASGPATLNGASIQASRASRMEGAAVLAAKSNLEPRFWKGEPPAFERHIRSSLAYRLSLIGQGRFDAMITFRPTWEWDVAAGSLIAQRAGAVVSDATGVPPRFNGKSAQLPGMIAAAPALHGAILGAARPFPAAG
ncbi:Inositol-1-monophosphatase [Pseudoruegeria aquimaris]|uniref:Inositol-1-monophosphatase n=1 Tax=Pseudoruegeria aquimaris TaxID=393663 RepID=A0A1Y5TUR0_9RHOB|nr:3'(2'),5'-bisphosphate nucleotidase CysQ [Pseudoruegeria aquimaris]SLN68752.1 Inositol-1-monophosphatase [Pseudoruegeria aquimaris]